MDVALSGSGWVWTCQARSKLFPNGFTSPVQTHWLCCRSVVWECVYTCMHVAEAEPWMHGLSPGVMSACSTVVPIPKYCPLVVAMPHTCTPATYKGSIYYVHHMKGLAGLGVRCHLSLVPSPLSAAILSCLKGGVVTSVDFLGPGSRSHLRFLLANQIAEYPGCCIIKMVPCDDGNVLTPRLNVSVPSAMVHERCVTWSHRWRSHLGLHKGTQRLCFSLNGGWQIALLYTSLLFIFDNIRQYLKALHHSVHRLS